MSRRRDFEALSAAPETMFPLAGRTVKEWVGKTPNSPVPPRVRARVFVRDLGHCQCGCTRRIGIRDVWETDHTIAIINGGENRESNLRTLLKSCHDAKSAVDVAEKSKVAKIRNRHIGIRKRSSFACSRDSRWKKKINGQVVRR